MDTCLWYVTKTSIGSNPQTVFTKMYQSDYEQLQILSCCGYKFWQTGTFLLEGTWEYQSAFCLIVISSSNPPTTTSCVLYVTSLLHYLVLQSPSVVNPPRPANLVLHVCNNSKNENQFDLFWIEFCSQKSGVMQLLFLSYKNKIKPSTPWDDGRGQTPPSMCELRQISRASQVHERLYNFRQNFAALTAYSL